MNKIFKVIWNPATGSYTVASETAKSRGKKSGRSKLLISALVAGGLLSSVGAYASVSLDGGKSAEEIAGETPLSDNWIAIGKEAVASSDTMGTGTTGTGSVAVGARANAGVGSTAIGFSSNSSGERSVALGQSTVSTGSRSIAIGSAAKATSDYTLALGNSAQATAEGAMALGKDTVASAANALALGRLAKASGTNSIATGSESAASGEDSLALGRKAKAENTGSMAMGAETEANFFSSAIGYKAKAFGWYSLAMGSESKATGEDSIALGYNSDAAGKDSIAMGSKTKAAENATAVGTDAKANGLNSIALGSGSIADADNTIALGSQSQAIAAGTIAIGQGNKADGANAIALGNGSITGGANAIALGQGSYAGLENGTAIGAQASAQGKNSVALGADSVATEADTVSVGNTTAQRKIVNMAKGDIDTDSTDAINGSQLYAISKSVADNLGGGATVNSQGVVTSPNYRLKNGIYGNVGDALADLNTNTIQWDNLKKGYSAAHGTNATSKITNVTAGDLSATSTDAVNGSQLKTTNDNVATNTTNITNLTDTVTDLSEDALKWDDAAGAFTAAHGTNATNKITNVTAGELSDTSTDAVNGSQLKTTNDNVATNTTNITNLTDTVTNLGEDALKWDDAAGAFTAAHGTNATNKISNVQAGIVSSDSTDAINGSQLYGLADSFTSYLGGGADISDTGVLTGPTYSIGGTDYTNVGDALAAINTSFSDSLGDALLWDTTAGKFSAKHGINNDPSVITDIANGAVSSTSSDAINGSQLYGVSDYIADALGGNAVVNADGSITAPTYAIAGGSYSNVGDALEAIDTTLDDALLWDATANDGAGAFSAGRGVDNTASKITNVANGAISATSSDAINGSQLYTTNKYIADALGGDAEVNADGTITAPTYTIANAEYNNVGDALDALDENALLWDATANNGEGAYNASHDGKASIITNVADGNIGEGSTDAINGSQLFNTNMLIQQNSEVINQLAGNTSETYIEENGAGINYVRTNDTGLTFTDASAAGIGSTAVGYNSVAKGDSSVAIGQGSSSIVDTSIALGSSSVSSRVIVKGSRDTSVSEEGVVIGYDTTDGELLGALSIGDDGKYRQIINVADGSEAHDAVTVRQLQNAIGAVATTPTKYYHANSTAEDSLAVGEDSLAMGAKTIVNGNAGIGIGLNTLVLADAINGIAIGSNARANHANSIAMGNGSQTTRGAQTGYTAYNMDAPQNSVGEFSVGSEDGQRQITNVAAGSADTDAVNVGQLKVTDAQVSQNTQSITNLNNQVTNLDTRVTNIENGIGDIVTTGSTKYFKTNTDGVDANAQGKDSVAIGSGSIAAADNSVALGTGSVANEENTISVGSSTNQRRITNVAAGVNATDAVNVSQLKSSEAGGVRYDTKADGSIDYSNITLGGGNGGTTRISNVSAGVNNNDAVNYAQLKQSVQETKQYTDQRMVEMDNKLSKTESKLSGGIASAMAMTGLPQAYTPGASMASIGGGTYNGESAVALGVSMVSANGRWVYKLQGSTNSQGEYSAALGAGIQW
ncbi:YadA-like family protein [Escherichia coli]|uniref:YadA-like family protein n=1 Tax=Escherichia coli TaxID=562 RepID=UPI000DE11B2B|nr:YadA-like family protein [Escherichia coli]EHR9219106.1 YadA-like family protein [Escherichia coli]MCV8020393.1 YadA-like family protein [Escherichia coli]MEB6740490.1 YadA-like family protein [Escherichia coli]HBA5945183.1 adhesin [Escherichia coli]HCP0244519.1 YadA-like family protein [Escherichia coli]